MYLCACVYINHLEPHNYLEPYMIKYPYIHNYIYVYLKYFQIGM